MTGVSGGDVLMMPAARHQRVDGAARIGFGPGGIADLYQRAPCRLLFPDVEAGEPVQAVSITTSGGLTGGDRVAVEMAVAGGAAATMATQAAEKLYRVLPGEADIRIETRVTVGAGGWAEWLGQEAILFDRSRVRRSFTADLAPGARLLAVESLVFGRGAMGERVATGAVHDGWRIRRGGRLIWADALRLEGDVAGQMAAPFGFGDATAMATVVYVGAGAAGLVEMVRETIKTPSPLVGEGRGEGTADAAASMAGADASSAGRSALPRDPSPNPLPQGERALVQGGATSFDDMLIVRLLSADAAALRRTVIRVAGAIRASQGFSPRLPAVWYC